MLTVQHQQLYEFQKKDGLIKGKKMVAMLIANTDNSSNESLFPDEKPKANNRNNAALDRKGCRTRQSHADTG